MDTGASGEATCNVLLVDDEPAFLEMARVLLDRRSGLRIIGAATSGREALAMLPTLRPDLVILDVLMPDMNGFEATRKLLDRMPRLRILIVSAYDDGQYDQLARSAGAAAFLPKKQLSPEAVVRCLQSVT